MLVRKITTEFGKNAGKIWKILSEKGNQTEDSLKGTTELDARSFHAAIGWLAREDKISKYDNQYQLDNTNLTDEIGTTAGKVYKILDIWEQADIETLVKLADADERKIYTALGWLAREGKIDLQQNQEYSLKLG